MSKLIKSTFKKLVRSDSGATLVEYGIAITLAVGVGIAGLQALGGGITGKLTQAEDTFD